jgi:hypothetical protein
MGTANYWNFSKSKSHNSAKNGSTVPKTKPDQDILMIKLYIKFHFSMCSQSKENERKLQIIGIFRILRAITLSNLDLDILMIDCVFTVLHPAQEYFIYMETSPMPVKGCKI